MVPISNRAFAYTNFVQNMMYMVYWYIYDISYLVHFHFTVVQSDFMDLFDVFQCNSLIWLPWAFSIICVCTIMFEFGKLMTNSCFRWSRILIALFKPFLSFNSISSHQIRVFYQCMKLIFIHFFGNIKRCLTKTSIPWWLMVRMSLNFDTHRLMVGLAEHTMDVLPSICQSWDF